VESSVKREVGRWRVTPSLFFFLSKRPALVGKCPRPTHPSWTSRLLPGNIKIKELLAVSTLRMMQLSAALRITAQKGCESHQIRAAPT